MKKEDDDDELGGVLLYRRSLLQAAYHTIHSDHELIGVELNGFKLTLYIWYT
jgi:hypothetical protein